MDTIFKYKTNDGNVGSEIVKFAKNGKFDMIVIGVRGLGGVKRDVSWKPINYVIHKITVSVLVK